MKERGILYSAPMVLSKLAGRKTQTRRIVKFPSQPTRLGGWERMVFGGEGVRDSLGNPVEPFVGFAHSRTGAVFTAFKTGDRLWTRETWGRSADHNSNAVVVYRADNQAREALYSDHGEGDFVRCGNVVPGTFVVARWRPSIFMPRGASRLLDEIVSVRVERLQDISEADAKAEGVASFFDENACIGRDQVLPGGTRCSEQPYRASYECLWEEINGDGAWAANPLVWVIETKPVEVAHG